MRAIFELGHPAHVHLFKNTMWELQDLGWQLKIIARPREITLYLLDAYGFKYDKLYYYDSFYGKVFGIFKNDFKYFRIARDFNPDLFVGEASPYSALVSTLIRKPYIAFDQTDTQKIDVFYLSNCFTILPFTDVIFTPINFRLPIKLSNKKFLKFKGYYELAYLHPNNFKPDVRILEEMNLNKDEKFIIIRIASLNAIHDIGQKGFKDVKEIMNLFKILKSHCKIFVTSEINIPELEKYKINLPPEKIHHLLAFATMYIGEGATMASEAGVLGVPWVFIYTRRLCYLDDQERNYGLGYIVNNSEEALRIALDLLKKPNLKEEWAEKRMKMLNDKIDVTHFMTELIKGYPGSVERYRKENRNLQ